MLLQTLITFVHFSTTLPACSDLKDAAGFCTQHISVTIKAQLVIYYSAQVLVRLKDFYILTINLSSNRVGVTTLQNHISLIFVKN